MRVTLARLTTNVLNPFVASFIMMVLLAFRGTAGTLEAIKWASISVALSVLPVLGAIIYLVWQKKLDGVFVNPRQQRTMIYLLASVLGIVGWLVLRYGGGPELLEATFAAGLVAIVIFMVINLFWKISLHTAFVSGAVAVLIIVYGAAAAWSVLLLPPVAWARMALKQHSAVQVVAGTILAAAIVTLVFWGYGIICRFG
jgi:membrane-associated phospholipid phosphatase